MRLVRPRPIKVGLKLQRLSKEQQERVDQFFWERVHIHYGGSSCWRFGEKSPLPVWQSGTMIWEGHQFPAAYFCYALHRGPIERGMYLWRTCGITNCVNPDHLMYAAYSVMEEWFGNRPNVLPDQVREARRLYREEHVPIHRLRERYRLTDREMRKILGY